MINANKYIAYPIIALIIALLIGGVVLAGGLLSRPDTSSVDAETSQSAQTETDQDVEDIEDIVETQAPSEEATESEELDTVPDFEEDEVYIEETEEDESEEDETSKPKKNPYYIKINKSLNTVTIYGIDENDNYTVPVKAMICSTGNATPLGKYNTKMKYTWKLLNGGVWGQYSTRIHQGILFHSVPMAAQSKDSVRHRYYNQLGSTASAGCVRLTVIDAKWIYDNCPVGTTVEIYRDTSSSGPLGKPSAIKLPLTNGRNTVGWDPTDPDPKNPWKSKEPTINLLGGTNFERGEEFDILTKVKALDSTGNDVTDQIEIKGSLDTNTIGEYPVTYSITDAIGRTASKEVTYLVKDTKKPVISLIKKDNVIPKGTNVDEFLLGRINVVDNGQDMDRNKTKLDKKPKDWGYEVTYTYTDDAKNVGTYKDNVLFDKTLNVTVKDKIKNVKDPSKISSSELKKAVTASLVNNNINKSVTIDGNDEAYSVKVVNIDETNKIITAEFTYKYAIPGGTKTISATVNIGYEPYVEETEPTPPPTTEPETEVETEQETETDSEAETD